MRVNTVESDRGILISGEPEESMHSVYNRIKLEKRAAKFRLRKSLQDTTYRPLPEEQMETNGRWLSGLQKMLREKNAR